MCRVKPVRMFSITKKVSLFRYRMMAAFTGRVSQILVATNMR